MKRSLSKFSFFYVRIGKVRSGGQLDMSGRDSRERVKDGAWVRVRGLRQAVEHNGRIGKTAGIASNGRLCVLLDPGNVELRLKDENVECIAPKHVIEEDRQRAIAEIAAQGAAPDSFTVPMWRESERVGKKVRIVDLDFCYGKDSEDLVAEFGLADADRKSIYRHHVGETDGEVRNGNDGTVIARIPGECELKPKEDKSPKDGQKHSQPGSCAKVAVRVGRFVVLLEEPAVKYVGELAPSPARYELNAKVWAARPLEENLKTVKDRNGDPVMRRTEDGRPEVELATVVNGVFGFHDPGGAEIGIEFEADRKDPQIMFMASWMGGGFGFTLDRTWLSPISPAIQALCTAATATAATATAATAAAGTQATSVKSGVDGAAGKQAAHGASRECSVCGQSKTRESFSNKQWAAKAHARKCQACTSANGLFGALPPAAPPPFRSGPVLTEGSRVLIQGLQASQYNNSTAVVKTILDNGRVCVLLDSPEGKELSVKTDNLIKAENLAGVAPTGREDRGVAPECLGRNATQSNSEQVLQRLEDLCDKLLDLEDNKDWRTMKKMEVEAIDALDVAGRGCWTGHLHVAGQIYNKLGYCNDRLGDYTRAIELFELYKAVAEQAGNLDGQSAALNNKGNCYKRIGSHDSAIQLYEAAKSLHEQLGDQRGIAQNLDNIGICLQKTGRHKEALPLHEEAWVISTANGFEFGQMRAALWAGSALWVQVLNEHDKQARDGMPSSEVSQAHLGDAEKWLEKALKLGEKLALNYMQDAQIYLACIAFLRGKEDDAKWLLQQHLASWMLEYGRDRCHGCAQLRGNDTLMLACKGCRVARYCNHQDTSDKLARFSCQRSAWKNFGKYEKAVSHKDICPMLRREQQMLDAAIHAPTHAGAHGKVSELKRALHDEMIKFLQRATAALPEGKVWLA